MFRPHGKLESVYKSGLIAVLFRLVFIGEGVPMRNRWPLVALCLALTVIMLRKLGVRARLEAAVWAVAQSNKQGN